MTYQETTLTHKAVLSLFKQLYKDTAVGRILGIILFDYGSLYISSKKEFFLTFQIAEEFVKNDRKPAPFHANSVWRHVRAFVDELYIGTLKQEKEIFPFLVMILNRQIQQTKMITYLIMFLLISNIYLFSIEARE